jgi:hypothetical protein
MSQENPLLEKALTNLEVILQSKPNQVFLAKRGVLQAQDEFVSLDDTTELEYAIYFTFHQLFLMFDSYKYDKKVMFCKLDDAIDNLYENEAVYKMIDSDPEFHRILINVDSILDHLNQRYFFLSPIYSVYNYTWPLVDGIYKLAKYSSVFLENLHFTLVDFYQLNRYEDSDEEDEENDGEENDGEENDGEENDGEEESSDTEEEEKKEK